MERHEGGRQRKLEKRFTHMCTRGQSKQKGACYRDVDSIVPLIRSSKQSKTNHNKE